MSTVSLASKLEQAAAAVLAAAGIPGDNIITGQTSATKTGPAIICSVAQGDEEPPFTGNYWMTLEILVRTPFAVDVNGVDPEPAHDTRAYDCFLALSTDTVCAALTATRTDFTAQGNETFQLESRPSQDAWESVIRGRIYCCGTAFPN